MSDAASPTTATKAIPIFAVDDVAATVHWFEEVLGWSTSFLWPLKDSGEAPWYAGVRDGEAEIHLNSSDADAMRTSKAYIYVADVDTLADAVKARGGTLAEEPKTYDYGMRDFTIHDPSGNQISFGQAAGEG